MLGICHFDGLLEALDTVEHIVSLNPTAVELVDHNVLKLGASLPDFRRAMSEFVKGTPQALLLVEFAEELPGVDLGSKLNELEELLSEFDTSPLEKEGLMMLWEAGKKNVTKNTKKLDK